MTIKSDYFEVSPTNPPKFYCVDGTALAAGQRTRRQLQRGRRFGFAAYGVALLTPNFNMSVVALS
jgi:hypothetical protein